MYPLSTLPLNTYLIKSNDIAEVLPSNLGVVPERNDDRSGKYGHCTQQEYVQRMGAACLELFNSINEKVDFKDILNLAGTLRQRIAKDFNTQFAEKFGLLRNCNKFEDRIVTPLVNEYSDLVETLLQIDEEDPTMCWEMYSQMEEKGIRSGFRLGICADKTIVKLTKYIFSTEGQLYQKNALGHTYPENLEKAFEECELFYNETLNKQSNCIPEYLSLASFLWWFMQATFFFRGSAACGEMIASALNLYKFENPLRWKEGVHIDRVALTTSLDEFVALFPTLVKI